MSAAFTTEQFEYRSRVIPTLSEVEGEGSVWEGGAKITARDVSFKAA